jgi:HAMP domain-containing protein
MNYVVLPIASWFHSAAPALSTVAAAFIAVVIAFLTVVARQRRKELSELLIAARVIESEMRGAKMAILQTIENDNLDLLQDQPSIGNLPTTWEQHRGVLAGHLTREQWDVVDLAVQRFEYAMYLTAPGTTQGTAFASIADALGSAGAVLEGYASKAGWSDNGARAKGSPQAEVGTDRRRAAKPSPVAEALSVAEAPPVVSSPLFAAVTEPSADSAQRTVPPYLLLPGAAVILSVLVVGVLVSERTTAVHDLSDAVLHDLPDAVRDRAQQTVAATTNQLQKAASWQNPLQKAASWQGPFHKAASWQDPFQKAASWRGPFRVKSQPPRLRRLRLSGFGIHR